MFVPIFRENFAICRTALGPFSNDGDGVEFSRASLTVRYEIEKGLRAVEYWVTLGHCEAIAVG